MFFSGMMVVKAVLYKQHQYELNNSTYRSHYCTASTIGFYCGYRIGFTVEENIIQKREETALIISNL